MSEHSSGGKTVLLVEDDDSLRKALETTLLERGLHIITARNGEEGLVQVLAASPDLILLDMVMPKMDGLSMVKAMREDEKYPQDVPIIFLTNVAGTDEVQRATELGVFEYLVKTDWKLADIADKVEESLK